jgi:hypothetical protein
MGSSYRNGGLSGKRIGFTSKTCHTGFKARAKPRLAEWLGGVLYETRNHVAITK